MNSPREKPKQTRTLLKREQLIEAGELEFKQAGFGGATSKSIAARAGVATGSFYQHFANKDELLQEIARRRMAMLHANLPGLPNLQSQLAESSVHELFLVALRFIYDFHQENPELHQVLEERRHLDSALHEILHQGEEALQERVLRFVRSFNLSQPEVVASNLFAMAEGIVHRHVFDVTRFSADVVIEQGAQMLSAYFELQR